MRGRLQQAFHTLRVERGLTDESGEELTLLLHLINEHGADCGIAREHIGDIVSFPVKRTTRN